MKPHFISLLFLFSLCASAQDTSMHMIYQQHRVKDVKIYEHKYKKEKPKGKGTYLYYEAYDRFGNLTLKYHEQNKAYLEMYEYDAQGNVIKSSNLSGNIMFTYSFQRKYDSTGTVNTETTITPPDDLIRYTYDNTGNCIRLDYYSSPVYKPEICSKYYFTYNEQNQMTQSAFHLENDTLYNMYKWEYDSAGHCTREMYILAGDTSLITQHTYDSLGNRIETIEYGLFSSYYKRTTYNSQGLIDHVIEYDQYRKRLVYYRYVYSFY